MKTVKAVLFDLDETLFDHAHSVAQSIRALRSDHPGLQRKPLDDILKEHRRLLELNHPNVMAGRLDPLQARIDRLRGLFDFCGERVADSVVVEAANLHRERYRAAQRAVPGAHDLLAALKPHTTIAIVTNNFLDEQRGKLRVLGFTSLVDALVTSEEVGCAKPDPEIFRVALERVECSADEAVMVGDSWEVDIAGARSAGIRAVWFNRDGRSQPTGERLEEITSLESTAAVVQLLLGLG